MKFVIPLGEVAGGSGDGGIEPGSGGGSGGGGGGLPDVGRIESWVGELPAGEYIKSIQIINTDPDGSDAVITIRNIQFEEAVDTFTNNINYEEGVIPSQLVFTDNTGLLINTLDIDPFNVVFKFSLDNPNVLLPVNIEGIGSTPDPNIKYYMVRSTDKILILKHFIDSENCQVFTSNVNDLNNWESFDVTLPVDHIANFEYNTTLNKFLLTSDYSDFIFTSSNGVNWDQLYDTGGAKYTSLDKIVKPNSPNKLALSYKLTVRDTDGLPVEGALVSNIFVDGYNILDESETEYLESSRITNSAGVVSFSFLFRFINTVNSISYTINKEGYRIYTPVKKLSDRTLNESDLVILVKDTIDVPYIIICSWRGPLDAIRTYLASTNPDYHSILYLSVYSNSLIPTFSISSSDNADTDFISIVTTTDGVDSAIITTINKIHEGHYSYFIYNPLTKIELDGEYIYNWYNMKLTYSLTSANDDITVNRVDYPILQGNFNIAEVFRFITKRSVLPVDNSKIILSAIRKPNLYYLGKISNSLNYKTVNLNLDDYLNIARINGALKDMNGLYEDLTIDTLDTEYFDYNTYGAGIRIQIYSEKPTSGSSKFNAVSGNTYSDLKGVKLGNISLLNYNRLCIRYYAGGYAKILAVINLDSGILICRQMHSLNGYINPDPYELKLNSTFIPTLSKSNIRMYGSLYTNTLYTVMLPDLENSKIHCVEGLTPDFVHPFVEHKVKSINLPDYISGGNDYKVITLFKDASVAFEVDDLRDNKRKLMVNSARLILNPSFIYTDSDFDINWFFVTLPDFQYEPNVSAFTHFVTLNDTVNAVFIMSGPKIGHIRAIVNTLVFTRELESEDSDQIVAKSGVFVCRKKSDPGKCYVSSTGFKDSWVEHVIDLEYIDHPYEYSKILVDLVSDVFVYVGPRFEISTSVDGVTWNRQFTPDNSIDYWSGSNPVLYSNDGSTW
jgi:hypothetical protein